MPEKIRWGILGTGRIAGKFAVALNYLEDAELYGIASRSEEKAANFAMEYSASKQFHDYESLAADPDVDVVYIATPHSLHKDNCLMCLGHGKAVLCEKPFTINAMEAVHGHRLCTGTADSFSWRRCGPASSPRQSNSRN